MSKIISINGSGRKKEMFIRVYAMFHVYMRENKWPLRNVVSILKNAVYNWP